MQTLWSLCSDNAFCLRDFAQRIIALDFKEEPDYLELVSLLANAKNIN